MNKKVLSMAAAAVMALSLVPTVGFAVDRSEVLARGDKDEWVTQIQKALHEQGYLEVDPTGYYGTDTMAAVMKFQNEHSLTVDAVVGTETRKALLGEDYEAIPETRKVNETDPVEAIYPGESGDAVQELQEILRKLGYLFASPTGYYGSETEGAVARFQAKHGIPDDGVFGEMTKAMLYSSLAEDLVLKQEMENSEVTQVQSQLKELGYFSGTTTGYYGPVTEAAIEKFQKANNLEVDGKTGPLTIAKLFSDDAKAYEALKSDNKKTSDNQSSKKKESSSKKEESAKKAESKTEEKKSSQSSTGKKESKTEEKKSSQSSTGVEAMIEAGYALKGKRYSLGSSGPNAYDCSGFVYACLKKSGVSINRQSSASYGNNSNWDKISYKNLKRGDLLFFKSEIGRAHV